MNTIDDILSNIDSISVPQKRMALSNIEEYDHNLLVSFDDIQSHILPSIPKLSEVDEVFIRGFLKAAGVMPQAQSKLAGKRGRGKHLFLRDEVVEKFTKFAIHVID